MTRFMLTLGAAASAFSLSMAQPAFAQEAPRSSGKVTYSECRKSDGIAGLTIGGVAGALIGGGIFGGLLGPLIGAAGGAFAGRAIDRDTTKSKRCRVVREEKTYLQEQTFENDRPNHRYEPSQSTQGYEANGYDDRYELPVREEDRDLVQPERS